MIRPYTQPVAEITLRISRGSDLLPVVVNVSDPDTGELRDDIASAEAAVRTADGDKVLDLVVEVNSPNPGQLKISLPGATSASTETSNYYHWDVIATFDDGVISEPLAGGICIVTKSVTKN